MKIYCVCTIIPFEHDECTKASLKEDMKLFTKLEDAKRYVEELNTIHGVAFYDEYTKVIILEKTLYESFGNYIYLHQVDDNKIVYEAKFTGNGQDGK